MHPTVEKLKDYLEDNGVKKTFFCNKIGVSLSMLWKWYQGTTPRHFYLTAIETFLDNVKEK